MKNRIYIVLLAAAVLAMTACGGKKEDTAAASVSAQSAAVTVTPEATETPVVTEEPKATETPTPEPTKEAEPTETPTPEPTKEPTAAPTSTPAPELTAEPVSPEEAAGEKIDTDSSSEDTADKEEDAEAGKEEEKPAGDYKAASGDEYLGQWYYQRANMEIQPAFGQYLVVVTWANSAAEYYAWEYYCDFEDGSLVCNGTGKKRDVVFGEDGNVASEQVLFADGSAKFTLTADHKISWEESVENIGDGIEFEW